MAIELRIQGKLARKCRAKKRKTVLKKQRKVAMSNSADASDSELFPTVVMPPNKLGRKTMKIKRIGERGKHDNRRRSRSSRKISRGAGANSSGSLKKKAGANSSGGLKKKAGANSSGGLKKKAGANSSGGLNSPVLFRARRGAYSSRGGRSSNSSKNSARGTNNSGTHEEEEEEEKPQTSLWRNLCVVS